MSFFKSFAGRDFEAADCGALIGVISRAAGVGFTLLLTKGARGFFKFIFDSFFATAATAFLGAVLTAGLLETAGFPTAFLVVALGAAFLAAALAAAFFAAGFNGAFLATVLIEDVNDVFATTFLATAFFATGFAVTFFATALAIGFFTTAAAVFLATGFFFATTFFSLTIFLTGFFDGLFWATGEPPELKE